MRKNKFFRKVKLLLIVDSFYKAGTERFTYEIHKELTKYNRKIDIISLKPNDFNHIYLGNDQYYLNKHKDLGAKIYFLDELIKRNEKSIWLRFINFFSCRFGFPLIKSYSLNYDQIIEKCNSYDVITWCGEYTVNQVLYNLISSKQIILMTTAKFQNKNLFEGFDFSKKYIFFGGFTTQQSCFELSEFSDYIFYEFPLYLEIPNKKNNWKKQVLTSNKIAIFTRLNSYKPLDPFFYALQLLQNKEKNTELHIFGYGDPELEGMNRYIDRIGLTGVYFRGNVESIYETLENEYFDLSWFQGYNNDRPAGYAGLDVASFGLPLICWDFHPSPNKMENKVFPHYKNLETFVEKSLEILKDKEKAEELSKIQFEEIIQNWDIEKNIHKLELIYQKLIEN